MSLLATADSPDPDIDVTEHERILLAIAVLVAGFETTTAMIANVTYLLLYRHPDWWKRLCSNPHRANEAQRGIRHRGEETMAGSRVPERPLALRIVLYLIGGVLFGVFVCAMKPDVSWTAAALRGLAFAVFYGLIFDAWYR